MNQIVWLSSYPKSGNTWVRAFLSSLLKKNKGDLINELIAPIISTRRFYDTYLDVETSNLTNDELECLQPLAIRHFAADVKYDPFFIKVHDAYVTLSNSEPMFPPDVAKGAIYILRNPLDVCVSLANHLNCSYDTSITALCNNKFAFSDDERRVSRQTRQKLLSWSSHVESWTRQKDIDVLVVRYEDLLEDPFQWFTKIIQFSGVESNDDMIKQAIGQTSFENLKKQEQQAGFVEKPAHSRAFFRSGKANDWRNYLSDEQVNRIADAHGKVMSEFGYL